MDEELKQCLQKIIEQLEALLKLINANTDKQSKCKHLATEEDFTSGIITTTMYGGLRSFKIVKCVSCGIRLQQEVK